jgi:hypothetical protein
MADVPRYSSAIRCLRCPALQKTSGTSLAAAHALTRRANTVVGHRQRARPKTRSGHSDSQAVNKWKPSRRSCGIRASTAFTLTGRPGSTRTGRRSRGRRAPAAGRPPSDEPEAEGGLENRARLAGTVSGPGAGLRQPHQTAALCRTAKGIRSRVRFWERNGSSGPLSGALRNRHRARLNASDVRKPRMTGALPGCALSSGRRGRRFKSGHPVATCRDGQQSPITDAAGPTPLPARRPTPSLR